MKRIKMKNIVLLLTLVILLLSGCKQEKKYHDEVKNPIAQSDSEAINSILLFQKKLNQDYKNPETSPLPDRFRANFESLDFFEPDESYIVNAKFVRTPDAVPFMMPSSTGLKSKEVVYGVLYFTLNGKEFQLETYQNEELMLEEGYEDYLFLPFTDLTNAEETYGGGRYIDLRIPDADTIVLDFNKAYNPYCVYNKKYSCPLVPSINHLSTRVLAGVKDFKKDKE